MSYKIDQRGSAPQRLLYQYLTELYSGLEIIYEFPLHELGQRIDIYLPSLAIAIEYNGEQHYNYISHFHKTFEDFKYQLELDRQKREYLLLNGIKLIDIPYNEMVTSKEELLALIQKTDYPDFEFKPLPLLSEKNESFKELTKKKRVEDYQAKKEIYKEDPDKRKERLLKEKQFRKERYKKMKENK